VGGPPPAVAATRSAVRAALAALLTDPAADGAAGPVLVLVACSGGPDSLALAAATASEASRSRGRVRAGAVVVDHDLQAGSGAVAAGAATACRGLGLDPVEVVRVRVGADGTGPEAAARTARYAALDAAAARHGAVAVLLGHTLDDQAEQVLLGLARGSGARSLAGMPASRGVYRRPLLGLARATVRAGLDGLGLPAHEDPANADPSTARARVRHRVLPVLEAELGPGVAAALARTADLLREDADALDAEVERAADVLGPPGAPVDVRALAARPDAVRRRVLRAALVAAGCPAGSLTRAHVLAVDALVTAWRGQGPVALPGGVEAWRSSGMLATGPRGGAAQHHPQHDPEHDPTR
jgi:tRNA(Ile)-lysidine synthase